MPCKKPKKQASPNDRCGFKHPNDRLGVKDNITSWFVNIYNCINNQSCCINKQFVQHVHIVRF